MLVLDHFLTPHAFRALHDALLSPALPWGNTVVFGPPVGDQVGPEDDCQPVHGFYLNRPNALRE